MIEKKSCKSSEQSVEQPNSAKKTFNYSSKKVPEKKCYCKTKKTKLNTKERWIM